MHIAILTAGGAGMFCGSCMHDNTLARALIQAGTEVSLIPAYTPIRVDERNVSQSRVFLGGVNLYLLALYPFWRRMPRFVRHWLDSSLVLRLASGMAVSPDAARLGRLTVALLEGDHGPQRDAVLELAHYVRTLKPDVLIFSNALMSGVLPAIRREFTGRVYCLLQGDDIFLNGLVEPYRSDTMRLLRELGQQFDGFLTHTAYYRDFMSGLLGVPVDRFRLVPLGIDLAGHDGVPKPAAPGAFTVGYFARVCPEKGLHRLVDAFRLVHQRHPEVRLLAGGYLGERDRAFFEALKRGAADLGTAFEYVGSPATHAEKVAFLKTADVLSVPTEYREPKGLYVLEALANGVPVVQPRHGSFPELIEATGGGLLVEPLSAEALAAGLEQLYVNGAEREALAREGHARVHAQYGPAQLAARTLAVLET